MNANRMRIGEDLVFIGRGVWKNAPDLSRLNIGMQL
jgi:hypothetical protein